MNKTNTNKDWIDSFVEEILPLPYPDQNMGLLPDESSELDDERHDANVDVSMKRDQAKQTIKQKLAEAELRGKENERKRIVSIVDNLFQRGKVYRVEWDRLAEELENPILPENQLNQQEEEE